MTWKRTRATDPYDLVRAYWQMHETPYDVLVEPDGTIWRRDDPETVRASHTDAEGVSRRPETLRPNPSRITRSGGTPLGSLGRILRNLLTRTRHS